MSERQSWAGGRVQGAARQHGQIGVDGLMGDPRRRVAPITPAASRGLVGDQRCASRCQAAARKARVNSERPRLGQLMSPALCPLMSGTER